MEKMKMKNAQKYPNMHFPMSAFFCLNSSGGGTTKLLSLAIQSECSKEE